MGVQPAAEIEFRVRVRSAVARSGAETRLTGIRLRTIPGVGRCNVTSTGLTGFQGVAMRKSA